jgi:hypothetical protein
MATIGLASQSKLGLEGVSSCSKILEVVIKVLRQEVQDVDFSVFSHFCNLSQSRFQSLLITPNV